MRKPLSGYWSRQWPKYLSLPWLLLLPVSDHWEDRQNRVGRIGCGGRAITAMRRNNPTFHRNLFHFAKASSFLTRSDCTETEEILIRRTGEQTLVTLSPLPPEQPSRHAHSKRHDVILVTLISREKAYNMFLSRKSCRSNCLKGQPMTFHQDIKYKPTGGLVLRSTIVEDGITQANISN